MIRKTLAVSIVFLFIVSSVTPFVSSIEIDVSKEILDSFIPIDEDPLEKSDDVDWWSMVGHDPAHTGYSTSTAPETNYVGWSYNLGGFPFSPVIVDNKVYCGTTAGSGPFSHSVFCLDADTGEKIWSCKPDPNCMFPGKISYAYGNLYLRGGAQPITGNYYFHCLDASNGDKVWTFTADTYWGFCGDGGPAVADEKVYFGEYSDNYPIFYCLDAFSGDIIWSYQLPLEYSGLGETPAVANGKVYFYADANVGPGRVYCLNANTGDLIWRCEMNAYKLGGPTIFDGKIYYKSNGNQISCRNADTGEFYWEFSADGRIRSPFAVAYGNVYLGCRNNKIYCINADTGSFVWSYETGNYILNSPVVADGKVYIGSYDNFVYCFNAYTGDYIWSYETGHDITFKGSAAIANGKLYIGSGDGKLYCFSGGDSNAPNPPTIYGPTNGRAGVEHTYTFDTEDPQGDNIYYYIEWGDGEFEDWIGPYSSGQEITVSHTWDEEKSYTIRAKAKDTLDVESPWSTLEVTMPVNQHSYSFPLLQRLLERFPNMFPILRYLIEAQC